MKKVKIAQIGINRYSHGPDIFLTLRALPEVFEIAGYALVEDERETCAEKLHVFEGYPELSLTEILNDASIEAVAVETDEIHLTKYATAAAKHGKHIHMEKPGSPSSADFDALIETIKSSGKTFHIGYMYRYNPYIADAIKDAKAGVFGNIFSAEAQMSRYDDEETRRWLSSFPGGMMFYLGCHLIDLILQIRGTPSQVIPLNRSTSPGHIEAANYGYAALDYPNGASFVKTIGGEIGGGARRQLVINGTKGSVEIRPLEISTGNGFEFYSKRTVSTLDTVRSEHSGVFDRYKSMMTAFASMVRGETENPFTPEYEQTLFHTLLACCGKT